MSSSFYVYEHWRPDTGACFYVGKGRDKRAWHVRDRNDRHMKVLAKLRRLGLVVEIKIVVDGLDEIDAFQIERARIAQWRAEGVELVNMTDGGDGVSGLVMSDEARAKMSARKIGLPGRKTMLGRKHSPETIEKMRTAKAEKKPNNFGKSRSVSAKTRAAAAQKIFYAPNPPANAQAKEARRQSVQTDEHRAACAARMKKRWTDPEFVEKMRARKLRTYSRKAP